MHLKYNLPSKVTVGEVSIRRPGRPEYMEKPCPPADLLKIYKALIVSLVKTAFKPLEIAWLSFNLSKLPFYLHYK